MPLGSTLLKEICTFIWRFFKSAFKEVVYLEWKKSTDVNKETRGAFRSFKRENLYWYKLSIRLGYKTDSLVLKTCISFFAKPPVCDKKEYQYIRLHYKYWIHLNNNKTNTVKCF